MFKYERGLFMNFETLCSCYLESIHTDIKESTFIRYRDMINNHILPCLSVYAPEAIDLYVLEEVKNHLLKNGRMDGKGGLAPKSVSDVLSLLKNIISYGQNHDLDIPCHAKYLKVRKENKETRVLSREEQKRLQFYLLNHMNTVNMGILLALRTGMRIGELCALTWENVDIPSGMIRVAATVQRISYPGMPPNDTPKTHLIITRPKSPSSYRLIPVSELLLPILMDYYSEPSAYLLTGLSRPMEPRTLQNRFQTALRQIPIYGASFHTLRHTFATRCVEAGFEIKSLSEILGHASVNITLNRYVHSSWETKRANMRKMDQFLNTL